MLLLPAAHVVYGVFDSASQLHFEGLREGLPAFGAQPDFSGASPCRDPLDGSGEPLFMKRLESAFHTAVPYLPILAVLFLRLFVEHPSNFVPLFSCLLFFAALRPRREFWIPLAGLMAVDVVLTTQHYGYALTVDHAVTWIWCAATMLAGAAVLNGKTTALRGVLLALVSAVGFFVVSNFAVWAIWQMYPRTMEGLAVCYMAALPFFRNNLLAEGVCSAVLFAVAGLGRTHTLELRARSLHF